VALLFTDIQGATALYERMGDMKAFGLVRQHFGVLREVIAAHRGALVKTIGDAVMASFHDPPDAVRAALDMRDQIRRFNDSAGEDLIALKIGAHAGPCIAVTLNERLDYFGQAVNLAARAQETASANEVCVTDSLYRLVEADESLVGLRKEARAVQFKGIDREVVVRVLGC
jgi:class 3 adenylate cyclase